MDGSHGEAADGFQCGKSDSAIKLSHLSLVGQNVRCPRQWQIKPGDFELELSESWTDTNCLCGSFPSPSVSPVTPVAASSHSCCAYHRMMPRRNDTTPKPGLSRSPWHQRLHPSPCPVPFSPLTIWRLLQDRRSHELSDHTGCCTVTTQLSPGAGRSAQGRHCPTF